MNKSSHLLDLGGPAHPEPPSPVSSHQPSPSPELSDRDQDNSDDDHLDSDIADAEQKQRESEEEEELRTRVATLLALTRPNPLPPSAEDEPMDTSLGAESRIENVKITQDFIKEIQAATLENGKVDSDTIYRLRNPSENPVDISDPDIRLSIDLFLAVTNASEGTYNTCRDAILRRLPESGILTYYSVKKLVAEISGVVAVYDDMCINSCHAFTGPFAHLETCTICGEARYDGGQLALTGKRVARQHFCTILLGPQLQALRRSHIGALNMRYLDRKMDEVADRKSVV